MDNQLNIPHIPVLLNETLSLFDNMKDGFFIDCTCGFGGHSEAILKKFPNIKLIAIDQDIEALNFAKKRLEPFKDRVEFIHSRSSEALLNFKDRKIAGILADIGVSSYQLDERERGFNFEGETLDMRMNQSQQFSAYDVVNFYSVNELERIFKEYGEERYSKKIAIKIVERRKDKKFTSSKELAEFIESFIPRKKIHPATQVFQAIRIEVNQELSELEKLLENSLKIADKGTILSIITFHSLEDRIVKRKFKEWSKNCICPSDAFRCECGNNNAKVRLINKKPLTASKEEILTNPRSRSAKVRGVEFL
ncbi:MAG: 16S rRNA (cytosine(1402)-N(4))-methyltransferase [Nautilia sp.]|nr:MAG: 16S rRNA (cytosine(1402)-N(4))-methyltransferase [Nautilia sp.]